MDELKPCPFCGGKPFMQSHPVAQGKKQWSVQCRCGARFFFMDRKYKAIEAWTRRAEDEELEFTRKFIHDNGLEFALTAAWNRRAKHGTE